MGAYYLHIERRKELTYTLQHWPKWPNQVGSLDFWCPAYTVPPFCFEAADLFNVIE